MIQLMTHLPTSSFPIPTDDQSGYIKMPRAGLIPFLRTSDGLKYLMMVASDVKFGGPRPMISKGKIEAGETPQQAAVREAIEELGLKERNTRGEIIEVFSGHIQLRSCAYDLYVFGVEIQDRYDFDKWGDETEYTLWVTLDEFIADGRRDHVKLVQALENAIS